jgi:hypothetical protein
MDALNDQNFYYGALVMGILMLFLMFYAAHMRAQSLYLTAKNKGREKIGDRFYYLVEESEYNRLTLPHLPKFGNADKEVVFKDENVPFVMHATKCTWQEYFCGAKSQCYTTDIRKAKFYWSEAEARSETEAFRLLYPLDVQKTIRITRADKLPTDQVALKAIIDCARTQRDYNQGNEDGTSTDQRV